MSGSGGETAPLLLITADHLRSFLEMSDAELPTTRAEWIIGGVSGLVLSETGREVVGFREQTEVVLMDGLGATQLLVPRFPLLDVPRIVEDPRGAATVLADAVDYTWSADGILERLDGYTFRRRPRWYEVHLEHGYAATPAAVQLVVARVCARAIVNPEALATESAGGYTSGFAFDDTRIVTLAAPDRRDLFPYRVSV